MQLIYMPPDPRKAGLGIGSAIGDALSMYAQHKMMQLKMQDFQKKIGGIITAPDRNTAVDAFASTNWTDPKQMMIAKMFMDEKFPKELQAPTEVTGYDPKTGAEIKRFIPKGETPKLNTPEGRAQVFGAGAVTDKPDVQEMYTVNPDGSYKAVGKYPIGQQPAGAEPMPVLQLQERSKHDQLAIANAQRADKRLELMMQRQTKEMNRTEAGKTLANQKAFSAQVQNLLNVKKSIGANGAITLDFEGDAKKADAYSNAIENSQTYLDKYGSDVNKAAVQALKDSGYYDKPQAAAQPTPAAPAPQQGFFSSLLHRLTASPTQATPTAAQPQAPTPAASSAFQQGQVYTDANGNKAKYGGKDASGKDIWIPL